MKKVISMVVVLALILSFAAIAYGAENIANGRKFGYNNRVNCQFIDADGNGICDNCPNGGVPARDGTGRKFGRQGR